VAFFPLEMTKTEVAKRFIAKWWGIPSNLLDWMKDQKAKIINDIAKWMWSWELWSFKIFKKDNRFDSIHQRIRREAIQNDTKVFVVDHLWLIIEHTKGVNKNDVIGYMTAEFKKTAEELWVAIILLSQLNRSGQGNNEPTLNSLRDSGNIEQDANVVMLLHKDQFPWAEAIINLSLAKVRDWQVWEVKMKFNYPFMRVTEQDA
jgi:replicative DNA helicase